MVHEKSDKAGLRESDQAKEREGQDAQGRLFADAYEDRPGSGGEAPADRSRLETNERGGVIARDQYGRITRIDYPEGITHDFAKFDRSGQPTRIKVTNHKTGSFQQLNQEGEGLWRKFNKDKPDEKVLVGRIIVDEQGIMRSEGVPDTRPLPGKDNKGYTEQPSSKITRDAQGHITRVEQPNGVRYQYSHFDESGQPTRVKITERGSRTYGEWIKEEQGLWRAYSNGKPSSQVIVGEWHVNEKGEMYHTGHQDMQPVSRAASARRTGSGGEAQAVRSAPDSRRDASADASDRGTSVTNADGSVIRKDSDGHVLSVKNPKGETTRFGYTGGQLTEMRLPGGTTYKTRDGKTWTNAKTKESSEFKLDVDPDGKYVLEKGGKKAAIYPNGTVVGDDLSTGRSRVTHPTGTVRLFEGGESMNPNLLITPEGREVKTDGRHGGEYEVKSGDTLTEIARDLLVASKPNDLHYKPSRQEVTAAVDSIVKANSLANRNTIERGQKLKIPAQLAQ